MEAPDEPAEEIVAMSVVYVSPRHTADQLVGASVDGKLEIFEAQMKGWLLDHADALASGGYAASQHAGISILALCLVYVESIVCFIEGKTSDKKSQAFFTDGLVAIFPESEAEIRTYSADFYREVRCGLLHQGMTRGKIGIRADEPVPIRFDHSGVGIFQFAMINPLLFLKRVKQHFEGYLASVRDPANTVLRSNFEVWFDNRAT